MVLAAPEPAQEQGKFGLESPEGHQPILQPRHDLFKRLLITSQPLLQAEEELAQNLPSGRGGANQ
jgi:hypothetical protein